ncbi:MAG TPA: DUF1146 family protein [Tetragenococcus sp.]|nr:DUF1146 family protein [Tetragenococcus sp.]
MQIFGIDAVLRLVCHFAFIYLAFWSLGSLRLENLFKSFHTTQIRMLITLLAISIGFLTSSFFLEIIALTKNLFISLF